MNKFLSTAKGKVAAGLGVIALGSNVFAAGTLTVTSLDTSDFAAVAGVVLIASGLIWSVKKGLALLGK
jgi:hypothetical protein